MYWELLAGWYQGRWFSQEYERDSKGKFTGWCREPGSTIEVNYLTGQQR